MADGVVVPQVHGGGLGRPEPDLDLAGRGLGALDLERGRVFLPELLDRHGDAAGDIAEKRQAERAFAIGGVEPGTPLVGALLDGESVGGQLRQPVAVPIGGIPDVGLLARGEFGEVGHALAGHLVGEDIAALAKGHHAPAGERFNGLGPHAHIAAEADVAVLHLFPQRHEERHAQTFEKVLLRVAIPDKRVNHADGFLARVKVEADGERQPCPGRSGGLVDAFDLDHGADRAALLERDGLDLADEILLAEHLPGGVLRTVFEDGDELAVPGDLPAADGQRLEEVGPLLEDAAAQGSGIDLDGGGIGGGLEGGCGRGGGSWRQLQRSGDLGGGADGVAGPHERTVRPISQRPGLDGHGLARGGEGEGRALGDLSFGPRNAPTDSLLGRWRRLIEPVQSNGLGERQDGQHGGKAKSEEGRR